MTKSDLVTEWKPVLGYEGLYEVCNDGRVKSLERRISYVHPATGKECSRLCRKRILSPFTKDRYATVCLYDEEGPKTLYVHRLVAEAFLDNPESKPQVNHINGNKLDNREENLEWATSKENYHHALLSGLITRLKLSESEVKHIRRLGKHGEIPQRILAEHYGVCVHQINGIVTGRYWKAIA